MTWKEQLQKGKWAENLIRNQPAISFATTSKKKDFLLELVDDILDAIAEGKVSAAIDSISLGLYVDSSFVALLKKEGILRHSRYLGARNPVPGVAVHVLKFAEDFSVTPVDVRYLNSLIAFEAAYEELNRLHHFITTELRKWKNRTKISVKGKVYYYSKVKALLAVNDSFFLQNWQGNRADFTYTQLESYPKEDLSEGISFLTARYNELVGFDDHDLNLVDTAFATSSLCQQLILAACQFKTIKEAEISMEEYGFVVRKQGTRVLIEHPDEAFAKSIDLANILYELQHLTNVHYSQEEYGGAASLRDLAKVFHEKAPDLFQHRTEPFERYVLLVPPVLFHKLLSSEQLSFFREEVNTIQNISRELLIPYENLQTYEITPGLSFHSFIKLCRFFQLLYILIEPKLKELVAAGNKKMMLASCIASFKAEDLKMYLSIVEEKEKVELFLRVISWNTEDRESLLDLQYTPLIFHQDRYMVPPCLTGLSNLNRSIFLSEAKKGNNFKAFEIAKHIAIGNALSEVFGEKGFVAAMDLKVRYKTAHQNESDIDFLAYRDGVLLIAECKDTIHPTDLFEMRTTLNHLKKAANQLQHNLAALQDGTFKKTFLGRLNIDSDEITRIVPAIILSNNKFYGYQFSGFPVRNVRETLAFVTTGHWRFSLGDQIMTTFHLWKDEGMTVADLETFFNAAGFHEVAYSCMNPRVRDVSKSIQRRFFTLNLYQFVDQLKTKLRYTETPMDS